METGPWLECDRLSFSEQTCFYSADIDNASRREVKMARLFSKEIQKKRAARKDAGSAGLLDTAGP
jgi:hypothetical protein